MLAVAAMVTLLLGTAPVVGQSDPPDGGSDVGSDEPAEPDPSEGGDGGGSLLCGEFDISEGWDESDVPGLHACLFDSVKGAGSGEPSVRPGHDGDETVRSSACGDVDVEFVDEFVDSDPFGFSRRVRIVYFVHLTCEDGTPAVGVSTRATMVVGPGAGSGADDCSVVRGSGYSWVSPPAAGGCVSYDFHGNALAAHRFDLTRSQSSAFRQVLVWADVDANGAYDPGEGFVLAPASPEPPLPSAPVGVSLASFADGSGVRVGWGRPTNHATAAPIGTYEVQWRASGEAAYPPANTVSAAVPPADVAGLTAGESYVLRVRAVDGAGRAGAWSTETTETARVLAAPGVVSTRSLSAMLRVSWEPPANQVGFVPVADYVVRWRPTSATNFDANNVRRGFSGLTVRGLTLGQTYALQARAVDIDGRGGAWSPEITATPQGPSGNGLRLPVSSVLVSNVAQPGASALGWASGSVRYAQRFTAGTADSGYWLEAAGIRFDPQARTIDDFDITAELLLETASGDPGAVIATLATPEVIVPGAVNWFYAPAGTQLEPSNLYYLAVATTDPGDDHQLIQTLSTGEDDSSAAGWSISNSAHSFDASRGAWNQIPGILQVDIRGTQPPAPPANLTVTPGDSSLDVAWDTATGVTAYDIEYRKDDEATWRTHRSGIRESFTIGGLQAQALYWVRVRGVRTVGGPDGATLYTTDWSAAVPRIVGDWTPPDLRVTPDDRALIVTWDDLPVASAFEVEYWPLGMIDERAAARSVRGDDGWFARIADLDNGEPYGIAVRSVRRAVLAAVSSSGVDETLRSGPLTRSERPGGFSVGSVEPGFVTSGATATVSVRLVDSDDRPFANVQMGAEHVRGRTFDADNQTVVSCYNLCRTNGDGSLTLSYKVASLGGEQVSGDIDVIRVYRDVVRNRLFDLAFDPFRTAVVEVLRGVNYVALGDSYSAGENGDFDEESTSRYLTVNNADPVCHRWSLAYPLVFTLPDGGELTS